VRDGALERLEQSFGIPLPAPTQWEIVAEIADEINPVYEELIRQAARGEMLHNDDTSMTVLALNGRKVPREKGERTDVFTTGGCVDAVEAEDRAVLHRSQACRGEFSGRTSPACRRAERIRKSLNMCLVASLRFLALELTWCSARRRTSSSKHVNRLGERRLASSTLRCARGFLICKR